MLVERDESYGNTPLHVACSLHSYVMTKELIDCGLSLDIKNIAGLTPFGVVFSEIEKYKSYVDSPEVQMTLERLYMVKTLFKQNE